MSWWTAEHVGKCCRWWRWMWSKGVRSEGWGAEGSSRLKLPGHVKLDHLLIWYNTLVRLSLPSPSKDCRIVSCHIWWELFVLRLVDRPGWRRREHSQSHTCTRRQLRLRLRLRHLILSTVYLSLPNKSHNVKRSNLALCRDLKRRWLIYYGLMGKSCNKTRFNCFAKLLPLESSKQQLGIAFNRRPSCHVNCRGPRFI